MAETPRVKLELTRPVNVIRFALAYIGATRRPLSLNEVQRFARPRTAFGAEEFYQALDDLLEEGEVTLYKAIPDGPGRPATYLIPYLLYEFSLNDDGVLEPNPTHQVAAIHLRAQEGALEGLEPLATESSEPATESDGPPLDCEHCGKPLLVTETAGGTAIAGCNNSKCPSKTHEPAKPDLTGPLDICEHCGLTLQEGVLGSYCPDADCPSNTTPETEPWKCPSCGSTLHATSLAGTPVCINDECPRSITPEPPEPEPAPEPETFDPSALLLPEDDEPAKDPSYDNEPAAPEVPDNPRRDNAFTIMRGLAAKSLRERSHGVTESELEWVLTQKGYDTREIANYVDRFTSGVEHYLTGGLLRTDPASPHNKTREVRYIPRTDGQALDADRAAFEVQRRAKQGQPQAG